MKNIGTFRSHICKNCTQLHVNNENVIKTNSSQPQVLAKLCMSCDNKTSVLEDIVSLNYFELFSLPIKYQIDKKQIDKDYKSLQKLTHPDLLSALKDETAVTEAQNASSYISKSFNILNDDYERAKYLMSLLKIDIEKIPQEKNEIEEIVELNMSVDEVSNDQEAMKLLDEIKLLSNNLINEVNEHFDKIDFSNIKSNKELDKHIIKYISSKINYLKYCVSAEVRLQNKIHNVKINKFMTENNLNCNKNH